MAEIFNPYSTRPLHNDASINRQRLQAVPEFGAAYQGRLAYDILRRNALIELALDAFPELGVAADPLLNLAERAGSPAFEGLAQEFGARIATLIAVLRDGHADNRETRPSWNDAAWDFWATCDTVWLAGGLVAGPLGGAALAHAQRLLGRKPHLALSPLRRLTPLVGAARSIACCERVRVLDFGQTTLKRGTAEYDRGVLKAIHLEEGLEAPVDPPVKVMEELIVEGCRGWTGSVSLSMSAYELPRGGPVPYGDFGKFYPRVDHVPTHLERLLGVERVVMIHDGTAAARALAPSPRSAVIVLGTALGIGVPPATDEGLAGLASDFQVFGS